jgi:hypothetical protein
MKMPNAPLKTPSQLTILKVLKLASAIRKYLYFIKEKIWGKTWVYDVLTMGQHLGKNCIFSCEKCSGISPQSAKRREGIFSFNLILLRFFCAFLYCYGLSTGKNKKYCLLTFNLLQYSLSFNVIFKNKSSR